MFASCFREQISFVLPDQVIQVLATWCLIFAHVVAVLDAIVFVPGDVFVEDGLNVSFLVRDVVFRGSVVGVVGTTCSSLCVLGDVVAHWFGWNVRLGDVLDLFYVVDVFRANCVPKVSNGVVVEFLPQHVFVTLVDFFSVFVHF